MYHRLEEERETVRLASAAPTRDLSADDLSLLNVLHSELTSITLYAVYNTEGGEGK